MSLRSVVVRTLAPLVATGVLAAALVAVSEPDDEPTPVMGTPAVVDRQEVTVVAPAEQAAYTPAQAAEVDVVDATVPRVEYGTVVAELAPHDLPAFELLGVTWTEGVTPGITEVQVRWRQDGAWSPWTRLEIDTQEVEGGIPGTEPRWVGASDAAQARIVSASPVTPVGLNLVTVAPGAVPVTTPAAVGQPGIIPRAAWGADNSGSCDEPRYGTMAGTIVHHTAGSNNYTAAESAGIVKAAQAYHMGGQKWCDIGYNFLVDRYGQIFEGRRGGINAIPRGAHSGNSAVNLNTTGVSLMGTFVNDVPPQPMKDALVRLLAWKHSLHGVPAKGTYAMGGKTLQRIDGHYNVLATACPGQQVITWMNAAGGLRDQVESAMAAGSAALVQVPGRPEVWLVGSGQRHHVSTYAELMVLSSRLGWVAPVPAGQVDGLPVGRPATRYVHDPRTGTLYLLQADGTRHRFPDVSTIGAYGYAFDTYVNLTGPQIDAFAQGPEVGTFFRSESSSEVWRLAGGTKQYVTTPRAFALAAADGNGYVASMAANRAAAIPRGPSVLEPHTLVRESQGDRVFLTLGDSGLLHIPSFELAAEFGARAYSVVSDGTLALNPVTAGSLAPFVACEGTTLLGTGGTTRVVQGADRAGWTPVELPAGLCRSVPRTSETVEAPFFVQVSGLPEVFALGDKTLHHVRSADTLWAMNGNRPLRIQTWSVGTRDAITVTGPLFAPGSVIQFDGRPEVYRADGRTIRHVTTYEALVRMGQGAVPTIERVPDRFRSFYTIGTPID